MKQSAVYVNFYRNPGSDVTTFSPHKSREEADFVWDSRWHYTRPASRVSKKQRVACIRVDALCIDGRFDL
jgi:hypothetical protein